MAEQEANQGTENPQTSEQAGEATANGGGAGGQVFSQDEVNRMIKARAERELKGVLADVGLADLGELKTLVQQKRAAEDANKSELAKAQERTAELEKSPSFYGLLEAFQAQAVGNHKDAAERHRPSCQHGIEKSRGGGRNQDDIVEKRPEQVLPDGFQRLAG